jgi:hypothetical protein
MLGRFEISGNNTHYPGVKIPATMYGMVLKYIDIGLQLKSA